MRRTIANILILILAFALEHSIFPFLSVVKVAPNLVLIVVFTIAFVYGEIEGILFGILGGVLMDLFYSGPIGLYTLIYAWIGYFNGVFSKYYYENYIMLPMTLCIVNEFMLNGIMFVFMFLINGTTNFSFYLRTLILPELVITIIFTLILYRPILACNSALKRIDEAKKGVKNAQ